MVLWDRTSSLNLYLRDDVIKKRHWRDSFCWRQCSMYLCVKSRSFFFHLQLQIRCMYKTVPWCHPYLIFYLLRVVLVLLLRRVLFFYCCSYAALSSFVSFCLTQKNAPTKNNNQTVVVQKSCYYSHQQKGYIHNAIQQILHFLSRNNCLCYQQL